MFSFWNLLVSRFSLNSVLLTPLLASCSVLIATANAEPVSVEKETTKIVGKVIDVDGQPVRGTRVTGFVIEIQKGEEMPIGRWETFTDQKGEYAFEVPSNKNYEMVVDGKLSTAAESKRLEAEPGATYQVEDLTVRAASGSFKGILLKPDGTPASGLLYGYSSRNWYPEAGEGNSFTGPNGEFEAPHLLTDEPTGFWVATDTNTAQIWKNVDTSPEPKKLVLQPDKYVDLLPFWNERRDIPRLLNEQDTVVPSGKIEFELPDLEGNMVSLSDTRFQNKAVIVNIWGSWCGQCISEIPEFLRLQSKYGEQGLELVGIAFESGSDKEQLEKIQKAVKRHKVNYLTLQGGETDRKHVESVIQGLEGFKGYPTTFFIGRDGKVADILVGYWGASSPDDKAGERKRVWSERMDAKVTKILSAGQ